ncbi:MAG: 4Fe-4S cluster-binding domain-containing protein [Oscillospiraceae bacterium]
MNIKALLDEDFVNFKECSMFIGFPTCTWKCGKGLCQNSFLATSKGIEVTIDFLIDRFIKNPISKAIVFGGLEPMDSFNEVCELISKLRENSGAYVVIYTGYESNEINDKIEQLKQFDNIIVKFGRYLQDQKPHFDEILGVMLQSDNQYAEVIS